MIGSMTTSPGRSYNAMEKVGNYYMWELWQKHDKEVTQILKETGCFNKQGQIQRWNGPAVVPRMKAAGHSSLSFENCTCKVNDNE